MIINGADKLINLTFNYDNINFICKRVLNPFMGSYSFHFEDISNPNKVLYKIGISFNKDNDMVSVSARHSEYIGYALMKVPHTGISNPSNFLEVVIKIVKKYNNVIF